MHYANKHCVIPQPKNWFFLNLQFFAQHEKEIICITYYNHAITQETTLNIEKHTIKETQIAEHVNEH